MPETAWRVTGRMSKFFRWSMAYGNSDHDKPAGKANDEALP